MLINNTKVIWMSLILGLSACNNAPDHAAAKPKNPTQSNTAPKTNAAESLIELVRADVSTVMPYTWQREIRITGTLAPGNTAQVKARANGQITALTVNNGDVVKRGQVIGQIETLELQARLDQQRAGLESAKAQAELAESNLTQNRAMLKEGFISQAQFNQFESQAEVARANVKAQAAALRLGEKGITDAKIIAPLDGMIANQTAHLGDKVAPEQPLMQVMNLNPMEMTALVSATDVPNLARGQKINLTVEGFGGEIFSGQIDRISPSTTDAQTRTLPVYVRLANAGARLKGGMFAEGQVVLDSLDFAQSLPETAILALRNERAVYVLKPEPKRANYYHLVRTVIQIGRTDDGTGTVEITAGLNAGDQVVRDHLSNLRDGQLVLVVP